MVEALDGFYNVDDGTAGADANVSRRGGEVVFYGEVGGGAFGGFNWVHGGLVELSGHGRGGGSEREDCGHCGRSLSGENASRRLTGDQGADKGHSIDL